LTKEAVAYAAKAAELAPYNKNFVIEYANTLASADETDSPAYKDILERYPQAPELAYLRVKQATKSGTQDAQIGKLQKIANAGSPDQPSVSVAADSLYGIFLRDNEVDKAHQLATKMASAAKQGDVWHGRVKFTEGLTDAQRQIQHGNWSAALATLGSISKLDDASEPSSSWYLLNARALAATGQRQAAFNSLIKRFVAQPSNAVLAAINEYGQKMGVPQDNVHQEVWKAFSSNAKMAHPFTFKRLDNGQPVALSDYRGHVVIVDFWYPNCGPCRSSFPYLQQVAEKYKNKGLVVLAINGIEAQESAAEPFLRRHQYDFIGLAGNEKFATQAYGVIGFPGTFLIGPDGKIYMEPDFPIGESAVRSTEVAISLLLAHGDEHPGSA
jgi:thiol-disulfide isomerase/thioredoxin